MDRTFYTRKSTKRLGIALTIFFFACTCVLASVLLFDNAITADSDPPRAVFFANIGVFGIMTLSSTLVLAKACSERLSFTGTTVSVRLLFQRRQFDAGEIQSLQWGARIRRTWLIFRTARGKVVLNLTIFDGADQLAIIRLLRRLIPQEKQEGWPMFCHRVALTLRDGISPQERRWAASNFPREGLVLITRKRYDRLLVVLAPITTAVACVAWWRFRRAELFALPPAVVLYCLILRFDTPSKGKRQMTLLGTSEGRLVLLLLGAFFGIMPLLLTAAHIFGLHKDTAVWIADVFCAALFIPTIYFFRKLDKKRARDDAAAAGAAAEQWNLGEHDAA